MKSPQRCGRFAFVRAMSRRSQASMRGHGRSSRGAAPARSEMVEKRPLYYYLRRPGGACRAFRPDAVRATRGSLSRLAILAIANEGGANNACIFRDAVRGGRRAGHVCGSVRRGAEGKCAGRDARGLEPRSGRAGESGVPRAGGQELRKEPSRRQGQDYVVREESAVRGAQDRAARRQGSRRLLSRARPDRIHHRGLHRSARRLGELEPDRAVGAQGLDSKTARPTAFRRRPTPSSSTTTRTC